MFYTTPVLVFPSNIVIAQYKTYYEQNGYVTNIFINLSLGHISNELHPTILLNCIIFLYIRLCPLPPVISYPRRLADSPLPSTHPTLVFPSDPCPSPQPQAHPVSKMDCLCSCLARMEPMLETCVLSEGLVLNHKQWHSALCSLLYSPSIGFRAPSSTK